MSSTFRREVGARPLYSFSLSLITALCEFDESGEELHIGVIVFYPLWPANHQYVVHVPGPSFWNSGDMFGCYTYPMAKNLLWLLGAFWLLVSVCLAWLTYRDSAVRADLYYFAFLFGSVQALWFFYWVRAFRNRSNVRWDHSAA